MPRLFCAVATLLLAGCSGLHGLHVEALEVSTQPPNQVAALLEVTNDGEPVTGLTTENFTLYEDDQRLAAAQAQPVLLDPDLAAVRQTLLLVDNSLATDKDVRAELASAVAIFVDQVRSSEPVAVYAFDGGPDLRLVAEFARDAGRRKADFRALAALEPADTSRNLNGAIHKAVARLDALLAAAPRPLKLGTLVVFAGGPDLAGRMDVGGIDQALREKRHSVFAIGIGDDPQLRSIGRTGYIDAHSAETLSLAFEETGHRVRDRAGQYYLLAYCSPARAGTRRLRLELRTSAKDRSERSAEASTEFDASGFTAGCAPRSTPRFHRGKLEAR